MKNKTLAFEAAAAAAGSALYYGIKDFLPASRGRGWLRGAALALGVGPYAVRSAADAVEFAMEEFSEASPQTVELRRMLDEARARQEGAFVEDEVQDAGSGDAGERGHRPPQDTWPPADPSWWDRVFSLPPYAVIPGAAAALVGATVVVVRADRALNKAVEKALVARGVSRPNVVWGLVTAGLSAAVVVLDRKTQ